MSRPRLLDLFCGAGGAAVGYHRAGFDIVGVDNRPQPHYPFEFIQSDALEVLKHNWLRGGRKGLTSQCSTSSDLRAFDAIHASPPCQAYTVAKSIWKRDHPDLLPQTRELLEQTGLPWIIENVPGAPMRNYVQVCGLSLGLNVKRHRWFESNMPLMATPCGDHSGDWLLVFGHTVLERGHVIRKTPAGNNTTRRKHTTTERGREAMGIDWMNRDELSEAIPPAYTEFIGEQLMQHLRRAAA